MTVKMASEDHTGAVSPSWKKEIMHYPRPVGDAPIQKKASHARKSEVVAECLKDENGKVDDVAEMVVPQALLSEDKPLALRATISPFCLDLFGITRCLPLALLPHC